MSNEHGKSPVETPRREDTYDQKPVEIVETPQPPLWGNPDSYHQSRIGIPVDSHAFHYGNPVVSNPLPNRTLPPAEWTNENMRSQPNMLPADVEGVTSNGNVQSSFSPTLRTDVQDSSNSLFSDQDPWNMRHDTHLPPPMPTKIQFKKEPCTNRDPFGSGAELYTEMQLEDGGQQQLADVNKDLSSDHAHSSKGQAKVSMFWFSILDWTL